MPPKKVIPTLTMDIPLFIRLLEWAKEDAKSDLELHRLTEKAYTKNKVLVMRDYKSLMPWSCSSYDFYQKLIS